MNRTMLTGAMAAIACAVPLIAVADNGTQNYYTPPKLAKQGTSQTPITGPGRVVVKVLVNPDGSFAVQQVLRSTNHGDDAAALEIAKSSTYLPATRGTKKILAFYDFTLNFTAHGANADVGSGVDAALAQYERELRAGNYTGAQAGIRSYVAAHPNDGHAQADLGVADTYLNDYTGAAAAFDKAGDVPSNYKGVAAKAYVEDAVQLINNKDYPNGLTAAKRAVALSPGFASYDTLGMAELGSGDGAAALSDLQKAHGLAKPDIPARSRAANDVHLMQAYLANGSVDQAKQLQTEAVGVDPSAKNDAETVLASYYVKQAQADESSSKFSDAAALYEQAATVAPSQAALLYANAASAYLRAIPQPLNDKARADADKALAADANSPVANLVEGIALANAGKKTDAVPYLKKADDLAKAANDTNTASSAETALQQLNGTGSTPKP